VIKIDHTIEIKRILSDILGLGERLNAMGSDTLLLGNIPELDSVAVVTIILALEKKLGIKQQVAGIPEPEQAQEN